MSHFAVLVALVSFIAQQCQMFSFRCNFSFKFNFGFLGTAYTNTTIRYFLIFKFLEKFCFYLSIIYKF